MRVKKGGFPEARTEASGRRQRMGSLIIAIITMTILIIIIIIVIITVPQHT